MKERFRLFAGRPIWSVVKALFKPSNYKGTLRLLGQSSTPIDFLRRYMSGSGSYPAQFRIQTPTGAMALTAFNSDDIRTINEIFFRGDYGDRRDDQVVVDFGSNIGVSAAFFLTRNTQVFVYCHEPLPQNVERLKVNLEPFEGRYELQEVAVAERDGDVSFGWEPTGRYGGIGKDLEQTITVPGLDSNRVLQEVISRHGHIDLLKIDIESLEYELTARIPADVALSIRRIVIELKFDSNPLSATHEMSYLAPITTLHLRQ